MKQLVKENDICVLATAFENKPHCSLMAYACDDTGLEIFMATKRDSKKYRSLSRNASVSLLIDTRARDLVSNRPKITALTVAGRYEPLAADAAKTAAQRLRERHSHLKHFLEGPDVVLFVVKVESFLMLEGVTEAHFETVF
jgi:nitroimidazol reductase NimA-like FMN-containing flavoprotein (pyridoxamine 5'-phosphate oxidase superfamily)